jgi:hypothetical protein
MKPEKIEGWSTSDQNDMRTLIDNPKTSEPLRFRLELALLFHKYNPFNPYSTMTLDDFFKILEMEKYYFQVCFDTTYDIGRFSSKKFGTPNEMTGSITDNDVQIALKEMLNEKQLGYMREHYLDDYGNKWYISKNKHPPSENPEKIRQHLKNVKLEVQKLLQELDEKPDNFGFFENRLYWAIKGIDPHQAICTKHHRKLHQNNYGEFLCSDCVYDMMDNTNMYDEGLWFDPKHEPIIKVKGISYGENKG